jgi:hypothetical protein
VKSDRHIVVACRNAEASANALVLPPTRFFTAPLKLYQATTIGTVRLNVTSHPNLVVRRPLTQDARTLTYGPAYRLLSVRRAQVVDEKACSATAQTGQAVIALSARLHRKISDMPACTCSSISSSSSSRLRSPSPNFLIFPRTTIGHDRRLHSTFYLGQHWPTTP